MIIVLTTGLCTKCALGVVSRWKGLICRKAQALKSCLRNANTHEGASGERFNLTDEPQSTSSHAKGW
ncbi:hypothetical protein V2G26_018241 [Clonostachys chloroleuca]